MINNACRGTSRRLETQHKLFQASRREPCYYIAAQARSPSTVLTKLESTQICMQFVILRKPVGSQMLW